MGIPLFTERIPYKPFEYPEYYTEGWLKQAQAFWLHTEIPMSGDVKDWNEKLTPEEKSLVGNILLGFAQTECAVSDYWTQNVVSWFPKHEIQQMAMMFGSQETIHAVAYSYLNETLGLEDYEAFLHEPATAARFDNLVSEDVNRYTMEYLTKIETFAKKYDVLVFIVAHPTKMYKDKDGKIEEPTMYNIKGGGEWYDASYHGILVHRDYEAKTVKAKVLKVKFQNLGENGAEAHFKWEHRSGCFIPHQMAELEEESMPWE